jgi:hypothetical protein
MTIEQHEVIDFVGVNQEGTAILTVSDHLPWENLKEHLFSLQEKINAYLRFIESGEIYEKFPVLRGKPTLISVALKFPVPDEAQWFFTQTSAAIEAAGLKFETRLLIIN